MNLVKVSGRGLPAQVRLKGWKPFQDLRMARRNAFEYVSEFKLKDGECIVVTNSQWRSSTLRRFCLILQTKKGIPMICYPPTANVRLVENLTFELYEFLNLLYQVRRMRHVQD